MPNALHAKQVMADGIHQPNSYEFADEAARLAASGFTAEDKYKQAVQLDTMSIWALVDPIAPTWVQITNINPNAGVFGDDFQQELDNTEQQTGSTIFQTALSMTTPAGLVGFYRLAWAAQIAQTNVGDKVEVRIMNMTTATQIGFTTRQEPKDATNWIDASQFFYLTMTGVATEFQIQFRQQGGNTAKIRGACLEFWRAS